MKIKNPDLVLKNANRVNVFTHEIKVEDVVATNFEDSGEVLNSVDLENI